MIICVYKGGTSRSWPAETRRPRRSRRRALFEAAARLGRECWWVVGEQAGRKLHPKVESDISIDSESLELPRSDHERPAHDAVVGFQRGVGHPGVQQQAAHDAVALVAASAQACEAVPESNPRGKCPGCQTGGNPACLELQKTKGTADEGGCRMSGGIFQGAENVNGPWNNLATVPTTTPVAEESWTSLPSADSTPYSHVRYMSAPLGFCNVAEVEFYGASVWGWSLVGAALVGTVVYLVGGVAFGRKLRGKADAAAGGLAAHPHYSRFVMVHGLVMDGVAFARGQGRRPGGGGGRGGGGGYTRVVKEGGARDGTGRDRGDSGKEGSKRSSKKEKKQRRKESRNADPSGATAAAPAAAAPAAAAAAAAVVAAPKLAAPASGARQSTAGDGGRWVHVPT